MILSVLQDVIIMKRLKVFLTKPYVYFPFAICSGVLFYVILTNLSNVFSVISSFFNLISPCIYGVIFAYLFNPLTEFFKKRLFKKVKKENSKQIYSVILTIVCVVLAVILIIGSFIPSVLKSVTGLIENRDIYTEKFKQLTETAKELSASLKIKLDFSGIDNFTENYASKILETAKRNSDKIFSFLGNLGTGISNVTIGIIIGFCFLIAKKSLINLLNSIRKAVFKKEIIEKNNKLLTRCNNIFVRYMICTLSDAVIVGAATLIFTIIAKMPFAPLIAVTVAITNIIPTFGPMIGGATGIFFLILDKPVNALWFFIFICILQGIDGMVIKPVLFKDSLGIPASQTLVLIVIGGKIAGILGIILSIPFGAIFEIIYKETIVPKLNKRKEQINSKPAEEYEDGI